jgi:hypothetical protein
MSFDPITHQWMSMVVTEWIKRLRYHRSLWLTLFRRVEFSLLIDMNHDHVSDHSLKAGKFLEASEF